MTARNAYTGLAALLAAFHTLSCLNPTPEDPGFDRGSGFGDADLSATSGAAAEHEAPQTGVPDGLPPTSGAIDPITPSPTGTTPSTMGPGAGPTDPGPISSSPDEMAAEPEPQDTEQDSEAVPEEAGAGGPAPVDAGKAASELEGDAGVRPLLHDAEAPVDANTSLTPEDRP